MRNEIGEQINRLRQGDVRNLRGKTRHLMGRIGVKMSPQPVRLDCDIASRARRVPLNTACSIK
jgi:hypothetical protein